MQNFHTICCISWSTLYNHKFVTLHYVCLCVCVTCRTSGIALDLSLLSWNSTLKSKRSSTSSDSEYRWIQSQPHMQAVLQLMNSLIKIGTVLYDVLFPSLGSGADGPRTRQRDRQTGHPGRHWKPSKANAEVKNLVWKKSFSIPPWVTNYIWVARSTVIPLK